jgi:hypothetical protein
MAVIHRAQLTPTKLEVLAAWLPHQPWSGVEEGADLVQVGAFRFDDPAGEVGVETLLVRAGAGPVLQVPLTYRAAPLAGAEDFLLTTLEHSVLGRRWVYDGVGDPVHADVLHRAVVTGGTEADLQVVVDGGFETRPKTVTVRGSGTEDSAPAITRVRAATAGTLTTITTDVGDLLVLRVLGTAVPAGRTLTASWGAGESAVLAVVPG